MKKISIAIIAVIISVMLAGTLVWAGEPGMEQPEREELITVEEPSLSETGSGYVEWSDSIPVNAADVEVTDEEVEDEIAAILYNKEEDETDEEYIQRYSSEYLQKNLNTMDDLRDYVRDDLYHSKLQAAIFDALEDKVYVDSYAESAFALLKEYADQELQEQVDMYEWFGMEGWDKQAVAEDLGYETVEDFLNAEAMYYGNAIMLLDNLAEMHRITYNDEEVENAIRNLMGYYGYEDEMTIEEYIEMNGGDPWVFMVEKLNVEYHKVLSELEQYAVFEESEDPLLTDEEQQFEEQEVNSQYPPLTNFTATTIDGDKVSSDLFAGKDLTILNIWATWCGFCIEEMPELAEYASALPDNIQLVTICEDGLVNETDAREILEESGLTGQNVVNLVGGTGDMENLLSRNIYFPNTLFINSKGEVLGEAMTGGQWDLSASLDDYIQNVLGDKQ